MKELLTPFTNWTSQQKQLVLARVIQTWGSAPRPVGSAMLISEDLEMVGSVSGGCVEGAVLKEAKSIMGQSRGKMLHYGVSDEDAWAVGLSCGGKIQVYIQSWSTPDSFEVIQQVHTLLTENKSCILVTTLSEVNQNTLVLPNGTWSGAKLSDELMSLAQRAFEQRKSETVIVGEVSYFIQVFPRRSQLLIIGAAHITVDLVQLAHQFDFETVVIDPRGTFARNTIFTVKPDQLIEQYPSEVLETFSLDAYTYAVILSHDPKIDDDALQVLLKHKVAYIGALGSKKNHEKRMNRLLERGFSAEDIARINAPIGLDIGAVGAKEIALSIMGAVIRAKNSHQ